MYQQGPGQPLPSDRDTLRDLARRTWKWWRSLGRDSQALLIGLVLLVFLVRGCSVDDRPGTSAEPSGSLPTATATTSSSGTASDVRLGVVPEDPDRSTNEIDAEEYAAWLNRLGDLEVTRDSLPRAVADMDRLADTYGGNDGDTRLVGSVPDEGSRMRGALRSAADQLESGDRALRKGRYEKAEDAFTSATRKLNDLLGIAQADLRAIEHANGLRLTRDGAVPDDSSTDDATVISWIDGDTVDTDKGRVRVLGIDAPEMHEQCAPALAAKDAAAQLAPPGQRVELVNPECVQDTDKYGRLLRYVDVDVVEPGTPTSGETVDVGYSMLLSNLAEPRYDSREGYQWHPREFAYRATTANPAAESACPVADERGAFVLANTLAARKGEDEYGRRQLMEEVIAHPYRSAAKHLEKYVSAVRKEDDEKVERGEKEAAERAASARRRELARQRSSSSSSSGHSSQSSSPSSGGDPGYTGPRCYAPGGKTWRPC